MSRRQRTLRLEYQFDRLLPEKLVPNSASLRGQRPSSLEGGSVRWPKGAIALRCPKAQTEVAMTGIAALLRVVLLSLPLTATLLAGVTYDQTVRTGSLGSSQLVLSRVPSIDPPVFDISPKLYAPSLDGAPTKSFRILVEGERLVRIGKDVSTIFDLKVRTVTVVQPNARTYSVETFDDAQQRLGSVLKDWWSYFGGSGTYSAHVQKTGQTRQIQNQTAEEYRVIATTGYHGKPLVAGSSVYWMVPQPPLDDLAAVQLRWSQECGLPFPGMPPSDGDPTVFGAMARAASKLTGHPVLYVVESRPFPGLARYAAAPSYDASHNSLPEIQPAYYWDSISLKIDVTETAFSGFAAGAVDPSAFAVPAGYKKKTGRRYLPD